MKTKITLLSLLFSFLCFCQSIKGMAYDSTFLPIEREFFEGDFLVLDSFLFDLEDSYVFGINHQSHTSELSDFLEARPEWTVNIYVLMNTNYDTISTHFLRTRASDVYESLIYFNVPPSQFHVKDSVVTTFDKSYDSNQAFRKTIVEFKKKIDFSDYSKGLEEAYELNNHQYFAFLFAEMSDVNVPLKQTPTVPPELDSFHIIGLIDKFYKSIYQPKQNDFYKILPSLYEIEIGEANKYVFEPEYIAEMDITIAGSAGIYSYPHTFHKVTYHHLLPITKSMYLDVNKERAFVEFLGYEFEYDLDEMTNIPSNIQPKGTTKEKLRDLNKYIQPEFEYLTRGACNAYFFWDFNWDFLDSFTPKSISIDDKDKIAFIEFKDENRNTHFAQFDYKTKGWEFVEVVGNELVKPRFQWEYILIGMLGLFILAMVLISLIKAYR